MLLDEATSKVGVEIYTRMQGLLWQELLILCSVLTVAYRFKTIACSGG